MSGTVGQADCRYCGLPLGGLARAGGDAPQYCCFGCRLADAVARERETTGHARATFTRLGLAIFFTMNVMVFTLALWTRDAYHGAPETALPAADSLYELFRYVCLVFSAPVLLLLGGPVLEGVWSQLRQRVVGVDAVLLVGVVAAWVYSAVSVLAGWPHVYFEVACMVLVTITLGRWLEATCKHKTARALESLRQLLPEQVRVVSEAGEELRPLAQLQVGDQVRVLPGERVPADGVIARNRALVDEQLVSGESRPVERGVGAELAAGTLDLDGELTVRVTAPPGEGAIDRLVRAVREAAAASGRYQRAADRAARWFMPGVLVIAAAALLVHAQLVGVHAGLMAALAVVLIACPCALALATPMAMWCALGRASRAGVLLRDGDTLCRLADVRAACFDKTGTLTTGRPAVERFAAYDAGDDHEVLRTAAALAAASTHSFSEAVCRFAAGRVVPGEIDDARLLAGRGVVGRLAGGEPAWLGSVRLMHEQRLALEGPLAEAAQRAEDHGESLVCVGWDGRVRGAFVLCEQYRDGARQALDDCRVLGLPLYVLTGDHAGPPRGWADDLPLEVRTRLLPEEKLQAIAEVRGRHGPVCMAGDGVNDAPALAAADVGAALACGSDVSRHAAGVCLLGDDLGRLPWAIRLARRSVQVVRQNLFWAFGYNTVGVALAAFGLLNPIIAALAMIASSFLVVTNSLRLSAFPGPDDETTTLASHESPSLDAEPSPSPPTVPIPH